MSFIGSLFDASKGAGFQGQGTNIVNPTSPEGIAQAQAQQQQALQQQQQQAIQQQEFVKATMGVGGLQNQQAALGGLGNVAGQLQGVANGTGPNPAQTALANATGANVANQAALMAGQRGSGANAGLMARQVAQQGAGIQQQAAGQAANMQANQSLNALGQLGNVYGQQASIAGQQVGQQASALQGVAGTQQNIAGNALANQGQQFAAQQGTNQANVGMQSNINNANAGVAAINAGSQANILSKVAGAIGSGVQTAATGMAHGGEVTEAMAHGGPKSHVGMHFKGQTSMYASGGSVPKKPIVGEQLAAKGAVVPGKAEVKGDSLKNDKVKALLSPGEVVIPRSVMQSADPINGAAQFVAAVMSKHGRSLK